MAWASGRSSVWLWIGKDGGSSLRAFAAQARDRWNFCGFEDILCRSGGPGVCVRVETGWHLFGSGGARPECAGHGWLGRRRTLMHACVHISLFMALYATYICFCYQTGLREVVAVKCVAKSSLNNTSKENLLTEIELLKTLHHENIVLLKDFMVSRCFAEFGKQIKMQEVQR